MSANPPGQVVVKAICVSWTEAMPTSNYLLFMLLLFLWWLGGIAVGADHDNDE